MSVVKVVNFQKTDISPVISVVESARQIKGAPEQSLTNMYSADSGAGSLISGTWSSEAGKWHVDYSSRHEFCYLLAGYMILTDANGEESTFKAGDAFMIPLGFKGTWEVIEPVTKYYVIHNKS